MDMSCIRSQLTCGSCFTDVSLFLREAQLGVNLQGIFGRAMKLVTAVTGGSFCGRVDWFFSTQPRGGQAAAKSGGDAFGLRVSIFASRFTNELPPFPPPSPSPSKLMGDGAGGMSYGTTGYS